MFTQLLDALTAPHGVDRYLELVRPTWALRDARAKIVRVNHQTPDSVTLTLRPNSAWQGFAPGQFVQLAVEIDGVRHTRCYSPAGSAHTPDTLELTIRSHSGGVVSRHLRDNASVGTYVGLSKPGGDFTPPAKRPDQLLLISGGSGITPVLSIARTLCDEGHPGRVTFLHYSPTREHTLYAAELAELARRSADFTLIHAHTREDLANYLHGHLCREHLSGLDHHSAETFACGPPALLDTVREIWAEDGIEERLHVESFLPAVITIPGDEATGELSFTRSSATAANDGRTLLDQAEAAGLKPESGCRMGICHSCTAHKTSGSVRNVNTGEVISAPDTDIQICISVPLGDVELEI